MPEGHTIHRLARDLERDFGGEAIAASSPQGRFAAGAARLDGEAIESIEAYGKHLFVHVGSGEVLHVHLGLIGKFRRADGPPRDTVRLRLTANGTTWDLVGPMTCAVGPPQLVAETTEPLGPDPLRRDGRADGFGERLARRNLAIAAALLDQRVIAGIGNVYRAELLFLAGIHPEMPANRVGAETSRLWELTRRQLRQGVRLNRIVTVDPDDVGATSPGRVRRGDRLYAYKRASRPCRRCGTAVERIEIGGRLTWFCPQCQPAPSSATMRP